MDRRFIAQRIEMMGTEDYGTMVDMFKNQVVQMLNAMRVRNTRAFNLHQLKGMCFSVGLESLGAHIQNIEQMLATGAELTADMHLKTLPRKLADSILVLEEALADYISTNQ